MARIHAAFDVRIRDVGAEEDLPEGRDEVVDALDISTGGVADGPEIEDAFERSLGRFVAVELDVGTGSRHVDGDLVPDVLVQPAASALAVGVLDFARHG